MILEHDGIRLDFFERFPRHYKNIGIQVSGGADSSLLLYCLVKMLNERGQADSVKIWPCSLYDTELPETKSPEIAQNVIDWVKKQPGGQCIQELYVTTHAQTDHSVSKDAFLSPVRKYLVKHMECEVVIVGTNQGMPGNERPVVDPNFRGQKLIELGEKEHDALPWAPVDKKFIAAQYKKLGIEELSLITNSCVYSSETPCKECWWCEERYWAFGSYDYGLQ